MLKNLNRPQSKAFTLIEVTVVVIIVTIIAAFAIPNYSKAVAKSYERNAIMNLIAIRSAIRIFLENDGTLAWWNSLDDINGKLGLSIIDPDATYLCGPMTYGGVSSFGCTATHRHGWRLRFIIGTAAERVHCNSGSPACPSCLNAPNSCE